MNRDILKEILKDTYDILEAEDAKSAMEILDAENSEVSEILLDLVMSVMDGFQVLEELNMECKSESGLQVSLNMCYNKSIDMVFWSGIVTIRKRGDKAWILSF